MLNLKEIADNADMIVNGYAFTLDESFIKVLNINKTDRAAVLDSDGEVIETTMDDIELQIVINCFEKNKKYLTEAVDA